MLSVYTILKLRLCSVITLFDHNNNGADLKALRFVLIFLLLMVRMSFGQEMKTSTINTRFMTDVCNAFNGSVHVFSQPLHWQGDDWLTFGSIVAGAAALSIIDKDVRGFFMRNQGRTGDAVAKIGEFYGEPLSVVLITGSIYLFGNIADDSWARETAIIMTAALFPGGIYQTTAKFSAGRARPYLELGNYHFNPFRMEEDYYSFVSGHTLVAMTTSFVLASRINNTIVKGFLYSLGIVAGISRMYSDNHWISDVFLGGALAAAVTHTATDWHKSRKINNISGLNFNVFPSKNGLTINLAW